MLPRSRSILQWGFALAFVAGSLFVDPRAVSAEVGEIERRFQTTLGSLLVFLEAAKRGELKTEFTESPDFLPDSEHNPVRMGWKVRLGGI